MLVAVIALAALGTRAAGQELLVEIVTPANGAVLPVVGGEYGATTFQAKATLIDGEIQEDVTAATTFTWTFGTEEEQTGNPKQYPFDSPGKDMDVKVDGEYDPGPTYTDDATITVSAIGGDPVPEDDHVYYFGPIDNPVLSVDAVDGQPTNTTYEWGVNELLTIPGADDESSVDVQGAEASTPPGDDAEITCEYTYGGTSYGYSEEITVRKPDYVELEFYPGMPPEEGPGVLFYKNDPVGQDNWLGFALQYRRYRLYDQLDKRMPGVSVNEQWLNVKQPDGHLGEFLGPEPQPCWVTDPEGYFEDDFAYAHYRWDPPPALPTRPDAVDMATADQRLHAGSASAGVGIRVATFSMLWRTNKAQF